MEKFLTVVGGILVAIVLIGLIATLAAYPTMWAVNYLFSQSFLTFVFGTAKIGFWKSLILNFISGWLLKPSTVNTNSKK